LGTFAKVRLSICEDVVMFASVLVETVVDAVVDGAADVVVGGAVVEGVGAVVVYA
jgi:hypothetical protein